LASPSFPRPKQCEIVIDTIVLARELNLPSLLPVAFWLAATQIQLLAMQPICPLSDADRNTIISAAKPLRVAHGQYLFGWLDKAAMTAECSQPAQKFKQKTADSIKLWNPSGPPPPFGWTEGAVIGLCGACATIARSKHTAGSRRLWDELPSFFGFWPWHELLAAETIE
jgi:hypothetical protein